jgi:hypothetical protein
MDNDQTWFRALMPDLSRVPGIVIVWSLALLLMFWAGKPSAGVPAADVPNWGRGFGLAILCAAICLFAIVVGYNSLLEERAAGRRLAARLLVGLRAMLFLIPLVVFACAYIIRATMSLGLVPHQGTGHSVAYTSQVFAFHYFLWPAPDLADYLFPIRSVLMHTNAATEMLAQMCRAAAIVALLGAVVPALDRRALPPGTAGWLGRRRAQASVVLRRQVPIRFDEPARSWFGGLPQMPENIPWPRTNMKGAGAVGNVLTAALASYRSRTFGGFLHLADDIKDAPLHFIAQIACADLPKQIWDGRGPRDGWLLLFVDVLQMLDDGAGGLVHVLHIDRLGPERQPPDDMPTVRHYLADHIGPFPPETRDGVPKLWRRWPVDLVVQQVPAPPAEDEDSDATWEPTQVTGAELYGAPEDEENLDHFADAEPRPLTWRGALYVIEGLLWKFSKDVRGLAKAWEPGWLTRSIPKLEATVAQHAAALADATTKLQQCPPEAAPEERETLERDVEYRRQLHAEAAQMLAYLVDLSQQMTEDGLAAEVTRARDAHMSWVEMQRSELERMRRHILAQDLDAHMGDESWAAMKARMIAAQTEYWTWSDYPIDLRTMRLTVLDLAHDRLKFALQEDLLDLYTRSAAAQASIPRALRDELEPKLRNICRSTAPHRMGGPRDVLQGRAMAGDDDLLFQMGSDYAMGWMWGDLGALFVYLKPFYLKTRWFKPVEAYIDGH